MSNESTTAIVKLLPTETLTELQHAITSEFIRRGVVEGPQGCKDTSYEALVGRFGVDGNKQLKLNNQGYQQTMVDNHPRFELGQIPFVVNFDEYLNEFVYVPRGFHLDELVRLLSNLSVPSEIRDLADGNLEILIEPMLYHGNCVRIRNLPKGKTVMMVETLAEFLDWYEHTSKIAIEPIPYIGHSNNPAFVLDEYRGKDLTTTQSTARGEFKATPFLVGTQIDVIANSNIPQLVEKHAATLGTTLEQQPLVKSVFVEVGGHLIRMLTNRTPYSRFVKSPNLNDIQQVLELRAAVNITKGMVDCFGEVMPWTELLGEEGLDLEISMYGSYNNQTGIINTNRGSVNFTTYDSVGESLIGLLSGNAKCMAYELDGALV